MSKGKRSSPGVHHDMRSEFALLSQGFLGLLHRDLSNLAVGGAPDPTEGHGPNSTSQRR